MDIAKLSELFRSMEPLRQDDDLEDRLLTDEEVETQRYRESVRTNQWVKIATERHHTGEDHEGNTAVTGWFPAEFVSVLFAAQFCDDDTFGQRLWEFAQKGPFSKWDLRSRWRITEVLAPGIEPPFKGWQE